MLLPHPPLLAITDRRLAAAPLPELAERLFAVGLRWLSLRDKDLPPAERIALARALVERARPWGARVTLHGDPALARDSGAAGVHLPADGDPAAARALLGPDALIGWSLHDGAGSDRGGDSGLAAVLERARGAVDYVTLSPVFPSASKPGYGPCLGAEGLRRAAGFGVPVLGLGGIGDAGAVAACVAAGAAGVAVMGLAMREPAALAPLLKAVLEAVRNPGARA